MNRPEQLRRPALTWRMFARDGGFEIQCQLREGRMPRCPCCRHILEARPDSRLCKELPLGAIGYDLDCRGCRRFFCVVRHTYRSVRLLRMRRFVAAVRAVGHPALGSAAKLPA
jgi:hypothetical protein